MLEYAVPLPKTVSQTVTFEQFVTVVHNTRDTAPGPDGLPYSAWTNAGVSVLRVLYEAYLWLLSGSVYREWHAELNDSIMVFLDKLAKTEDKAPRGPKDTRALSLSNTDCKNLSLGLAYPLKVGATLAIYEGSRGFIKGRDPLLNIWAIEAAATRMMLAPGEGIPIGLFWDIKAAFPSLSRRFVFLMLKKLARVRGG